MANGESRATKGALSTFLLFIAVAALARMADGSSLSVRQPRHCSSSAQGKTLKFSYTAVQSDTDNDGRETGQVRKALIVRAYLKLLSYIPIGHSRSQGFSGSGSRATHRVSSTSSRRTLEAVSRTSRAA